MLLIRLKERFYEMMNIYIGKNVPIYKQAIYVLDYLIAYIMHGSSISDYFTFGFYRMRNNGRKEYITYKRYHKIQDKCNKKEDRIICRNKSIFNNHFSDFLGREWIDLKVADFKSFESFLKSRSVVFIKEVNGFRGVGVSRIETNGVDLQKLYNDLTKDKSFHYIVEEEITQILSLKKFHPWSINTIRIVTLYDNVNDDVHVINARIRIGNNKNSVDNLHYGGIGANIDIVTGIINTEGRDSTNNRYIHHPITGVQIVGFQIPYWNECIEYAKKAARHIPTVRYIGWDIVIKDDGSFILIEANDNADHDFQQLFCGGLWRKYKSIMSKF